MSRGISAQQKIILAVIRESGYLTVWDVGQVLERLKSIGISNVDDISSKPLRNAVIDDLLSLLRLTQEKIADMTDYPNIYRCMDSLESRGFVCSLLHDKYRSWYAIYDNEKQLPKRDLKSSFSKSHWDQAYENFEHVAMRIHDGRLIRPYVGRGLNIAMDTHDPNRCFITLRFEMKRYFRLTFDWVSRIKQETPAL